MGSVSNSGRSRAGAYVGTSQTSEEGQRTSVVKWLCVNKIMAGLVVTLGLESCDEFAGLSGVDDRLQAGRLVGEQVGVDLKRADGEAFDLHVCVTS